MRDKIIIIFSVICFFMLAKSIDIYAYTGNGTKSNPYVVTAESGLREILTELPKKTSWVYIAIDDLITISKNITISGGKYRIYAKDANRTIKRSTNVNAIINNKDDPQFCFRLNNNAEVIMGFSTTDYKLTLNGSKSSFVNNPSSGWFNVSGGSKLTLGQDGKIINSINNEYENTGSIIESSGILVINGEINNCESINGGAISADGGNVEINTTAKIYNCNSKTEGGALFINGSVTLVMNGGAIYNCKALEEGGAIFLGYKSVGKIINGNIYNNKSGGTGGGIFSGYGATLYIGKESSEGPQISENIAEGSGGGVRCNGGIGDTAGGIAYFYSGTIKNNISYGVGGGISCGVAGDKCFSKIILKNMDVLGNSSSSTGGGVWLPNKATGVNSTDVKIENCYIYENKSNTQGGGITIHCSATINDSYIQKNEAIGNGGGIYIGENALVHYKGQRISENVAGDYGNGVYVKGLFQISDKGVINSNNDVYLTKGTYIETKSNIEGDTYLNAVIRSAVISNGTKLVKVNYSGADSESELYNIGNAADEYADKQVEKRYKCNNKSSKQLLRPGKYIENIGNEWIVISEEYKITYNKNTTQKVENLPNIQKKYWNEDIEISNKMVTLSGYKINEDKHWNYLSDGSGATIKPGSKYKLNGNKILYAQWIQIVIQKLYLTTTDRYYVVGQKVALTPEELLKKVMVNDDLSTGREYDVIIVEIKDKEGNTLISGNAIESEKYIDTSEEAHYILKIKTSDETGKITDEEYVNVYIMERGASGNVVRFISKKFLYTLNQKSKWNNRLKNILLSSINNISSSDNIKIKLSKDKIRKIKESVINNNYIITNAMNKTLLESW